MKGIHSLAFAGVALATGLTGCSSPPERPAEIPTPGAIEKPFTATGNEPFWRIIIEPGQLVLERPAKPTEELRYRTVAKSETGRRFRATREGLSVEVVTAPQLCRDSMSGVPHPVQVRLFINGKVSSGCGGDPKRLIMGTEWVVEDIAGRDLVRKSRATMQLLQDGTIAGTGSCNRYTGHWSLNGETLEVGKLATTRKACPPELMAQEERFLRLLESARAFDISPQGALLISTDTGAQLRAIQAIQ